MKNYYLDKDIDIKGGLSITGSIITVKSNETFNNYNDLNKLSDLIYLDNNNLDIIIEGDLIIPECKNFELNIIGNCTVCNTKTLE
tara:strand:+ start:5367 stop:5621 length:255 start_codon:yes stop_codon:yes gene_type:complete